MTYPDLAVVVIIAGAGAGPAGFLPAAGASPRTRIYFSRAAILDRAWRYSIMARMARTARSGP